MEGAHADIHFEEKSMWIMHAEAKNRNTNTRRMKSKTKMVCALLVSNWAMEENCKCIFRLPKIAAKD
jgi:hypothetical protein